MTSVKVAVRVRPLNQREINLKSGSIISMEDNKTTITNPKVPDATSEGDVGREAMRTKEFTFDFSFWSTEKKDAKYASQEQVFNSLGKDVVSSACEGYNACVFAYGQTGSGKSYTMMGSPDDTGLTPRICKQLFLRMSDDKTSYRTEVSYLEIYNEKVRDLLKYSNTKSMHTLRVREHPKEGPYVQDLSKHIVNNYSDIEELMNRGNTNRTTAATNMNDVSSRSHAIFTIVFTQAKFSKNMPSEMHSKIHLVDLAGSERADASGATGQRLKEGASINKSLVTLGNVISVLAEMSGGKGKTLFIPYRDSVLTWLLKDSLGGNSKTIMVATISPAAVNYGETLSTLRYANRAKNIINKPTVNEDPNVKLIRDLRAEIARLKALLGGNIDNITTPKVQERLHENEARIKVLTQVWTGKWKEAANILKDEQNLALRKEGLGVVLDSSLPHLIGIDDDILSTGIMLYHIKEGKTTIGRGEPDEDMPPDIVIAGMDVERAHCVIEHKDGIVTLSPIGKSLCTVNGSNVEDMIKLTQGAVILLGRTNMFRFNHPAEAAKLREELKTSNLNLSRMSLLSQSMTDLYKSTDNLSFLSGVWDVDHIHREELEKLEEKRQEIEEMEDRLRQVEDERMLRHLELEEQLEKKQQLIEELELQRAKAEMEVEQKMSEAELLRQKEKDHDDYLLHLEEEMLEKLKSLQAEKEQELEDLAEEKNHLDSMKIDLEQAKQILEADATIMEEYFRQKWLELEHKERELDNRFSSLDAELKETWKSMLDDVQEENGKLEELKVSMEERLLKHRHARETADIENDAEREMLERDKMEIDIMCEHLKEEEKRVVKLEEEVLQNVEREILEFDNMKETEYEQLRVEKENLRRFQEDGIKNQQTDIDNMARKLKARQTTIDDLEEAIRELEFEIHEMRMSGIQCDVDTDVSTASSSTRDMVATVDVSCQISPDAFLHVGMATEYSYLREKADLDKKLQELEQLREECERTEADLDEQRRKMEEEHDVEQDKIEYEKLKLQEMEQQDRYMRGEHVVEQDKIEYEKLKLQEMEQQDRINNLVEQEVKRRLFEEKVQREKQRRIEREKEKKERQVEIEKIKLAHHREIKQLKAKLDKSKMDSTAPTKSNPYASSMGPDASFHSPGPLRSKYSAPKNFEKVATICIDIPTYTLRSYGSDTHYEYEVKISVGCDAWSIYRRYSRFREMHNELKHSIHEVGVLVFPPKKLFSRSEKVVAERRKLLEQYLKNVVDVCVRTPKSVLHPSRNPILTKQVLLEFNSFFKKGIFEASKHGTT